MKDSKNETAVKCMTHKLGERRLRVYITTEKMWQDWGDVSNHILRRASVKSTLCSLKAMAKIYMYAD